MLQAVCCSVGVRQRIKPRRATCHTDQRLFLTERTRVAPNRVRRYLVQKCDTKDDQIADRMLFAVWSV